MSAVPDWVGADARGCPHGVDVIWSSGVGVGGSGQPHWVGL